MSQASQAPAAHRPVQNGRSRPWISPQLIDFWASKLHPTLTWQRPLARVVGRSAASSDAVTLLLQPNRHWGGFRPGQHINLGVEVAGARLTRSYSPCDLPRRDGRIAITVKAIAGGRVSRHLCEHTRPGDIFDIGPAFGDMVLPDAASAPRLFLAAGSGITPLMAMTRALAADGMPSPLTLLYWARTGEELCFVPELRALAAKHGNFEVHFLLTRDQPAAVDEGSGRISEQTLTALLPDLSAHQVFSCGPGGFVAQARSLLDSRVRSFQAEAFSAPAATQHGSQQSGSVQVTLAASGRTLSIPRGQSVLTALEAAGLSPAYGCRMGICNTCACTKLSGSTRHLHNDAAEHEPDPALRICVNAATSNLVLDL